MSGVPTSELVYEGALLGGFIFSGGNHERPTDEVQPAFPANLTEQAPVITPTATSSGRRLALANWIASKENPLTSRVYANRVWSQYFSTGIVRTVNDFGKAGDRPSNQELLDYLAKVQDGQPAPPKPSLQSGRTERKRLIK